MVNRTPANSQSNFSILLVYGPTVDISVTTYTSSGLPVLLLISDAPIPVFTNQSDTDTLYIETANLIPILDTWNFLQEIHSILHLFQCIIRPLP